MSPRLAVLLLLAAPIPAQAASPVLQGSAAVEAYHRGDFETAHSLWLSELESASGPVRAPEHDTGSSGAAERGRLLYNLGNAAFRRGAVLEAVGWYSASVRVRPRDRDAWRNLEHARTTAKLPPADRGDLASTGRRLLSALTLAESEWLALCAAAVWAILLAGEALRGGRVWRVLSWTGLALVVACLAPWIYNRVEAARDPVLSVDPSERGTEIRSEPRADAAVIATVARGETLERVDELPEWIQVSLPDGTGGWARRVSVFPLRR